MNFFLSLQKFPFVHKDFNGGLKSFISLRLPITPIFLIIEINYITTVPFMIFQVEKHDCHDSMYIKLPKTSSYFHIIIHIN